MLSLAIDGRILPWSPQVVLLDNGCLCCTVRSDLVEAVKQILLKVPTGARRVGRKMG
jgi:G3E family GTPase